MSQMLTTDLILTEKICTKALYPRIAPLGFGSAFLNETEHPFPSHCSPQFLTQDLDLPLATWVWLYLQLQAVHMQQESA